MTKKNIKGTVKYQKLALGFWGIVDENDEKWRPVDMPKELQKEGLELSATVEETEEQVSIFMWGKSVKIKEYKVES